MIFVRKFLLLSNLLFFLCFSNGQAQQTKPFETVVSFFEAFHQKDSSALATYFDKGAHLNFTTNDKDGNPQKRSMSIRDFISRVCNRAETPVWEERLGEPKVVVHQNLATIWVPFEFYLDSRRSHSGYNLFQLFWNGSEWKIINLADTHETD
jgi:hypothetical protein